MPKKQLHGQILKACKEYLQWHKWFVIPIRQSFNAYKGISDLIALKNRQIIFIEIKTPEDNLSKDQMKFATDVRKQGFTYVVIHSVDELIDDWET